MLAPEAQAGEWTMKLEFAQTGSMTQWDTSTQPPPRDSSTAGASKTTSTQNQGVLSYDGNPNNTSGTSSFNYRFSTLGLPQYGVPFSTTNDITFYLRLHYTPTPGDANDVAPQIVAIPLVGTVGGNYTPPPSGYTSGTPFILGSTGLKDAAPVTTNIRGIDIKTTGTLLATYPNPTRETDITIGPINASSRAFLPHAYFGVTRYDRSGESTSGRMYAEQQLAVHNTLSGTRSNYGVYISSDIETSYKKSDKGPLPAAYKEIVSSPTTADKPKYASEQVAGANTPSDSSDDVWKLECIRNLDGSMTVATAQVESIWNLQWAGLHDLHANVLGATPDTSTTWDYEGPGDNYNAPVGDRLRWLTSDDTNVDLGLAFGTSNPTLKSGKVRVTTDYKNGVVLSNTYDINWHLPYEKQSVLPSEDKSYPSGTTYVVPTYPGITIQEENPKTIDVSAGFEGLAGALGSYAGGPPGALAGYSAAASIAQGLSGTFDLTWTIGGTPQYTFFNGADWWQTVKVNNPENVSHPSWLSDPNGFPNFDVTVKRITRWTRKRWNCDEYNSALTVCCSRIYSQKRNLSRFTFSRLENL